jgi:hypothetical protein
MSTLRVGSRRGAASARGTLTPLPMLEVAP